MARGFLIGEGFRDRIERTITRVDGIVDGGLTQIPTRLQGPQSQPKLFRICTFTGAWAVNASRTVTFKGVTTTPNTVSATNLFCGMNPGTVTCDVSIAKDGTAWFVVQPNLTHLPGYSVGGTQVMAVVGGNLRFIGTTAC